jgi:hypothetical protein
MVSESAFAAVPASRKHAVVKVNTSKLLKFFIVFSKVPFLFDIGFSSDYGKVTDRELDENEPPVTVPVNLSATPAPSRPTLPGNASVKLADAPGAMDEMVCGSGVPEVVPSTAVFRVTLVKAPAPVSLMVTVNV